MRKIIYIQTFQLVTLVVGIFVTPFYLRHISVEEYGFAVLFSQLVLYLGIFDFGIGSFLVQRIAVASMQAGLKEAHPAIISKSFGLLIIVLALAIPFSFVVAWRMDDFFAFSFQLTSYTKILLFSCFVSSLLSVFFRPLTSALIANEHLVFNSFSSTTSLLIYSIGSLVLLEYGHGLDSFLYAHLVSTASAVIMNFVFLRAHRGFQFAISKPDRRDIQLILYPSLLIFTNGLAAQIIYNGDRIILAKFVSVALLTVFTVNIRVIEIAQTFLIKLADLFIPKIIKVSNSNSEYCIYYYRIFTTAITVLTILAILNVIALNQSFVHLWVGDHLLITDFSVIVLYLCVMFSHVIFRIPSLFLYGMNLNKGYTSASLIDAFLNLTLSIVLAGFFGLKGIVAATLIATLVTSVPINIYLLHRAFGGRLTFQAIISPVLKPLLLSSPLLIVTYFYRGTIFEHINTWSNFAFFLVALNIGFIVILVLVNYRDHTNLRMIVNEINHGVHRGATDDGGKR